MTIENNSNRIKEISILDFPNNIFIGLPQKYRDVLFQLIFFESKTAGNVIQSLKENGLKENVFRWRRGHDKGLPQYINLESLLFLFERAGKIRDDINKKIEIVKTLSENSKGRVTKTNELIFLLKATRYILKGYRNMAKKFNINNGLLRHYIGNEKIKTLPSIFIKEVLMFLENSIICFSFSLNELESNIISYSAYHGKSINPEFDSHRKIPIKVTPEFESIIYHLFGDGHVKAIGSSEYTQINEKGKNNFLNKLYNVFGYFDMPIESFNAGRVLIPKAIIDILCKYYNLNYNSFYWDISQLPPTFTNDMEFKIAGLSAFIIDEGYINCTRGIEIYSGNNKLLSQMRELAIDLGLDCSELKLKKAQGNATESFRFRIRKKSSVKLIKMIHELKKKYPNCGLAQKEGIIKY